jgi:hypothetical protein
LEGDKQTRGWKLENGKEKLEIRYQRSVISKKNPPSLTKVPHRMRQIIGKSDFAVLEEFNLAETFFCFFERLVGTSEVFSLAGENLIAVSGSDDHGDFSFRSTVQQGVEKIPGLLISHGGRIVSEAGHPEPAVCSENESAKTKRAAR